MKKNFEITEENAIKLGNFINKKRIDLGYSTNHIQIHTGIDKADLSRIENAKKKKINPMQLKVLATELKMSQVELFKIAGFLGEDNFNTNNEFEKVNQDTGLSEFTKVVNNIPEDDMKIMLQEYLEKKEFEAYKDGTFEEKKEEFDLIRKAIVNGVEE